MHVQRSLFPSAEPTVVTVRFDLVSTWYRPFVAAIHAHYTGSAGAPPGRKLSWKIVEEEAGDERVVGWIGLGEPSFKLAPRRRLGLENARPAPDGETVSCFIYRLEERKLTESPRHTPAGMILRAWHPIAAAAWEREYGAPPVHWETMVGRGDAQNLGACFKRAGYRSLGWTTGRSARRPPGHTHGKRVWGDAEPKLVLYRGPLARLPAPAIAAT